MHLTDTDQDLANTEQVYYCSTCMKGHLPIGLTCDRSPRGEYAATCLRCCTHNHG